MCANWGGARPGAGRKRGRKNSRSRAHLLTRAMKTNDWLALIQRLREVSVSSDPGSLRAAALLMRYQFGDGLDSVERLLAHEALEAELSRRQAGPQSSLDSSQPPKHSFEDYVLDTLSKPGVDRIIWNSSQGRLCIYRVKEDSALEKPKAALNHDIGHNSEPVPKKNQDQSS